MFVMLELNLILMSQPLWVLKTAKDRNLQRLVHMSADLARQIGIMLEKSQNGIVGEVLSNILLSELQIVLYYAFPVMPERPRMMPMLSFHLCFNRKILWLIQQNLLGALEGMQVMKRGNKLYIWLKLGLEIIAVSACRQVV